MTNWKSLFAKSIARRSVRGLINTVKLPGSPEVLVELEFEFSPNLRPEVVGRLMVEGAEESSSNFVGTLPVLRLHASPDRLRLILGAPPPDTVRLDEIVATSHHWPLPLRESFLAHVMSRFAAMLASIRASASGVRTSVADAIDLHLILIYPNGEVMLMGTGLPALSAILSAVPKHDEDSSVASLPRSASSPSHEENDVKKVARMYQNLRSQMSCSDSAISELLEQVIHPSSHKQPMSLLAFANRIIDERKKMGLHEFSRTQIVQWIRNASAPLLHKGTGVFLADEKPGMPHRQIRLPSDGKLVPVRPIEERMREEESRLEWVDTQDFGSHDISTTEIPVMRSGLKLRVQHLFGRIRDLQTSIWTDAKDALAPAPRLTAHEARPLLEPELAYLPKDEQKTVHVLLPDKNAGKSKWLYYLSLTVGISLLFLSAWLAWKGF